HRYHRPLHSFPTRRSSDLFQFFAARGDVEAVRLLADHAIARHYPDAQGSENRYRDFYEKVIARQAGLVAQWLCVGFIHGVMNTEDRKSTRLNSSHSQISYA